MCAPTINCLRSELEVAALPHFQIIFAASITNELHYKTIDLLARDNIA